MELTTAKPAPAILSALKQPEKTAPPAPLLPVKVKKPKVKAFSPKQMMGKKRVEYDFEGEFLRVFGRPEKIAKWFITGPSFSGKSSFVFIISAYLTKFGNVDYDSFEEGDSATIVDKIIKHGLADKPGFKILPKVPIADLKERLSKRKSASFAVVDSVQHAQMGKAEYCDLVDSLCNQRKGKSLLFINHWIKNDLTKHIKHDCDIKVEIINFVARIESRFTGRCLFWVIWEDEAKKKWGKRYPAVIKGQYWPGTK